MRYLSKGGIWKNTEDEILKAAVMKYGLNQWSRISSLLVRKSAKECKARWYEWLDPSIKKTEWTREEEEKLLHLAKIFPTQWRTIAPIIGRTPAQCIEHYERLLDQAQGKGEADAMDEADPRRLRPGEIDPNPETKPCRPDPIDMDEDEKEMLQECRARLANTKGKKAKRKAREKQLEEARRMAQMQKQRELKAAGIQMSRPTKIRGVNYNVEIPFEKKVPEGRYDINALEENPNIDPFKSNIALQQIEMKRRDEDDKKKKALDEKRMKKLKQKNLPKAMEIINKQSTNEAAALLGPRTSLVLPAPQISDFELQHINKYASTSQPLMDGDSSATRALIGNYSQRDFIMPTPQQMKTPFLSTSIINQQAQQALLLKNAQTPLLGGPLSQAPESYQSLASKIAQTPSILLSKRQQQAQDDKMLPPSSKRVKQTDNNETFRLQTPLRDEFKLNTAHDLDGNESAWERSSVASGLQSGAGGVLVSGNSYSEKLNISSILPQPKHKYQLSEDVIMQKEDDIMRLEEEFLQKSEQKQKEEDIEDQERRMAEQRALYEELERKKQTQVVSKNMPRPLQINSKYLKNISYDQMGEADRMIQEELAVMISHDNFKYPQKGMKEVKKPQGYLDINPIFMDQARKQIMEECGDIQSYPLHNFLEANNQISSESRFFPATKDFANISERSFAEHLEGLKFDFEASRRRMDKEISRCSKLEDRGLKVLFGGYYKREDQAREQFDKVVNEHAKLQIEREIFQTLESQESKSIKVRLMETHQAVLLQEQKENELQIRFANLKAEKERLEKTLAFCKNTTVQ